MYEELKENKTLIKNTIGIKKNEKKEKKKNKEKRRKKLIIRV